MKIISGFGDGTFKPKEAVTRAQFIKMLDIATGHVNEFNSHVEVPFVDLNEDHWSYPYVVSSLQKGFVVPLDYKDGKLSPKDDMTREEMATMVARAIGIYAVHQVPFADQGLITDYMLNYVAAVSSSEIL